LAWKRRLSPFFAFVTPQQCRFERVKTKEVGVCSFGAWIGKGVSENRL